jgi:GTP cyclohydrolase IA
VETIDITWPVVYSAAVPICNQIMKLFRVGSGNAVSIHGIPRGGVYTAMAVKSKMLEVCPDLHIALVETPEAADVYIDDLIDSGATMERVCRKYGTKPFYSLFDKRTHNFMGKWLTFPWERMANETGAEDAIVRLIQHIGDDPEREGLKETPNRVIRSHAEMFSGYKQDPASVMKFFEDAKCDEMVVVGPIKFYSTCEHHLLPIIGEAIVGYIPHGRVIGLSKLARVVDIFARRLQVQERLTEQITQCMDEHLKPLGSACRLVAQHLCMSARGVNKQDSVMVTQSLTGAFREKPEARNEFLAIADGLR